MGAVTTFTLHESHPRAIGGTEDPVQCLQHPDPRSPPTHTVLIIIFPSNHHAHANGKLQTKGPCVTPSQVSWSLGIPYIPPMEARSVLVQNKEN